MTQTPTLFEFKQHCTNLPNFTATHNREIATRLHGKSTEDVFIRIKMCLRDDRRKLIFDGGRKYAPSTSTSTSTSFRERQKKKETRSRIRRRKRARLRIKYKTVVFGTAARDLRARIPQYRLRPLTAPINIQRWQLVTPHHANFKPTTTLNILRLLNRSRVQLPNNLRKRERERDADRVR